MSFDVFDRFKTEYQDQRLLVAISRYWNNPEIKIEVTRERINVMMTFEDFMLALHQELENPDIKLTWRERLSGICKAKHEKVLERLLRASVRVIEKTKEATSQVM